MILLVFNKLSINTAIKTPFLSYDLSLTLLFKKILKMFKSLLIISKISLRETFNISQKKFEIKYSIFNTFSLFEQNLILLELLISIL